MKYFFSTLVCLFFYSVLPGQVKSVKNIFTTVDQLPYLEKCGESDNPYRCSLDQIRLYLKQNLLYPASAKYRGLEGECVAQFYIYPNGRIGDIEIKNKLAGGIGTATITALEQMRMSEMKWVPGIINGEAVPVLFTLPIVFTLQDELHKNSNFKLAINEPIPNFKLPNAQGEITSIYEHLGEVSFIFFEDRSTAFSDAAVENRRYLKEIYKANKHLGFEVCHIVFFRFTHREFTLDPEGNYKQAKKNWARQLKIEDIPWNCNMHEAVNQTDVVCENIAKDINNTGLIVDKYGRIKYITDQLGDVPILMEEVLNNVIREKEEEQPLIIYIVGEK